ncbi:MAG: GIY-YIG nuclease family protein [Acidobacteria bacterium]|nr:MAG: GIY-YIG nuclease family protein [Acidobacteriota bacterium]REK04421.1 MAG: GIY-YIG nuclease family protein [Acidobacteriota bacterium]
MGVFQIRNLESGRVYVASSPNLPAIFNRMRMTLNTNGHLKEPELQQDWNQYGEDAFVFEVLEELEAPEAPGVDVRDDLQAMEQLWLEELRPWGERGYNRPPRGG